MLLWNDILSTLFPSICLCCGTLGPQLCDRCAPTPFPSEALLEGNFCLLCGEPFELPVERCLQCRLVRIGEIYFRSLYRYSERVDRGMKALKYGGRFQLAGYYAELLRAAVQKGAFPPERRFAWDQIVAVPSTSHSLRQRGYGHLSLIATKLARALELSFSPFSLVTNGEHPPQASLNFTERMKHLHRKFVADRRRIRGQRILLIDDIITSGATILGSILALERANALSVDVLTISRTEHFALGRYELGQKAGRIKGNTSSLEQVVRPQRHDRSGSDSSRHSPAPPQQNIQNRL